MAMQTIEDTRLVIGPNVSLRPREAVRWVAAVALLTFSENGQLPRRMTTIAPASEPAPPKYTKRTRGRKPRNGTHCT